MITPTYSILLIGGGPAGVELAAEIAHLLRNQHSSFPSPALTLAVSPRNGLLSRSPPRAGRYAACHLTRIGIRIIYAKIHMKPSENCATQLNVDSQVRPSPCIRLDDTVGEDTSLHDVDLVFNCTGAQPHTQPHPLTKGGLLPSSAITSDGGIPVTETLQLSRHWHIFIAGDAARPPAESNPGCELTAYAAEASGHIVAQNILILSQPPNTTAQDLKRFPEHAFPFGRFPRLFVISLYKFDAVLCVGPVVVGGAFPAIAKTVIERLGVAAARRDGVAGTCLKVVETVCYAFATALQCMASRLPFFPISATRNVPQ